MFGDGSTHGRPVSSKYWSRVHPFIFTTSSFAPMPKCSIEQHRQLADRHPVSHWNRKLTRRTTGSPSSRTGPSTSCAADRIRAIAHHDGQAMPAGGLQAVGHRIDIGVDARADVLQVDDQRVETGKHAGVRLTRVAVQREHAHATRIVLRVRRLDHVFLKVRSKAVLGTEQGADRARRRSRRDRRRAGSGRRPTPDCRRARSCGPGAGRRRTARPSREGPPWTQGFRPARSVAMCSAVSASP